MVDRELQELNEKYKGRDLQEELAWMWHHGFRMGYLSKADAEFARWLCGAAYNEIDRLKQENERLKGNRLTSLYVRDKESEKIRQIGNDMHDMLCIDETGKLRYMNLQNGDGCTLGDGRGGYEFIPNIDDHGFNADPREV